MKYLAGGACRSSDVLTLVIPHSFFALSILGNIEKKDKIWPGKCNWAKIRREQLRENKEGTKTHKQVKEKKGDDSVID